MTWASMVSDGASVAIAIGVWVTLIYLVRSNRR